jgi:hypothetical protein
MFTATPGNILFIVHIYDYGTEFRALMAAIAEGLVGRPATGAPSHLLAFLDLDHVGAVLTRHRLCHER